MKHYVILSLALLLSASSQIVGAENVADGSASLFQLKDKLHQGIEEKNKEMIFKLFAKRSGSSSKTLRDGHDKTIDWLLQQDVFDIEILELSEEEKLKLTNDIKSTKKLGWYPYTIEPEKKIMIRYRIKGGWQGYSFYLGKFHDEWKLMHL